MLTVAGCSILNNLFVSLFDLNHTKILHKTIWSEQIFSYATKGKKNESNQLFQVQYRKSEHWQVSSVKLF